MIDITTFMQDEARVRAALNLRFRVQVRMTGRVTFKVIVRCTS